MQSMVLTILAFNTRLRRWLNRGAIATTFYACITLTSAIASEQQADSAEIGRGAYLAKLGDCAACHTAGSDQPAYAGGLSLNSPFGKIYSTNITPDPVYGIGGYSLDDFSRAVRQGIAKNGRRLYPAMPYPSFAGISDDDIRALYAYFMNAVAPVNHKPLEETRLPFPFNLRWSLIFWSAAFVKDARYTPDNDRDAHWNRGAYLVQTLGHCGACHTPRGIGFQEKAYTESSPDYLSGTIIDNWFTANLRGDPASGLGRWSEKDIADFLETGHGGRMAAFGSMIDVVEHSTQHLQNDDLYAIAHYLKSLPPHGEKSVFNPDKPDIANRMAAITAGELVPLGAGIYQGFCSKCHEETGIDKEGKYPRLAGNSMVLSENPTSLIRLLLEGSKTAQTKTGPKSLKMPSFADKLTDRQIGEVLSFIRTSWGNKTSPVTTREVTGLRDTLHMKR
ncbi:MAG: c-type cytochrome [Methylomonas sp.]